MRIDLGPVYRVHVVRRGDTVVVLLRGGDKRHQDRDIAVRWNRRRGMKKTTWLARLAVRLAVAMPPTPWRPKRISPPFSMPCAGTAIPIS